MTTEPSISSLRAASRAETQGERERRASYTYRNAVGVLLTDTLGLSLALLEGVFVLELGAHDS